MPPPSRTPPIVVIYGDELHLRETALARALDVLLPPEVDRGLALTAFDGARSADQGGPSISNVLGDLATLPFLSDRRVVLIREADTFITAQRERLERYLEKPAPTGVLVLECRTFARTTRLHKAAVAVGGEVVECKRLFGRALLDFVANEARALQKRIEPAAAARLVEMIGPEAGLLAAEVEKLGLYVGDRPTLTERDVRDLVGQSREEKIFAVADTAADGHLAEALRMWQQVLATDPEAGYRAVGGLAFVLRRWLTAHRLLADGQSLAAIAPKVMMWGRDRLLQSILERLPPHSLRLLLAALAELDSQAKVGARSIDTGVEQLLVRLAAPAA